MNTTSIRRRNDAQAAAETSDAARLASELQREFPQMTRSEALREAERIQAKRGLGWSIVAMHDPIPATYPVQPLRPGEHAGDRVTCGHCGLSWDDSKATSYTPTPSGRCPFEAFHRYPEH